MNITIMNSLFFPGACKSGSATTCRRSKSILKHLSLWLLMLFALSGTAWAQEYYVFKSNNYYMCNNSSSVERTQDFDPATCIWTFQDSTLSNGGYYLYVSGNYSRNYALALSTNSGQNYSTWN